MASPGGNLGPHTMWLAIGVAAVALFGYKGFTGSAPPQEPRAELSVGEGTNARVVRIDRRECLAGKDRVWVVIDDGVECIAYMTAGNPTGSSVALMYFSGDIPDNKLGESAQEKLRGAFDRRAQRIASTFAIPVITVGRPGTLGSTGYHLTGGRRDEAKVLAAAVDALKSKLSIRRLALAGQSGGSRVIAQLMVMGRSDMQCAAMASGAYDLPRKVGGGRAQTNIFGRAANRYLVPLRDADRIVPDGGRRSFVIGDRRDTRTPFAEQQAWANKLKTLGHQVLLIDARAQDSEHHGLSNQAIVAAALCAKGRSDAEIRTAVQALK